VYLRTFLYAFAKGEHDTFYDEVCSSLQLKNINKKETHGMKKTIEVGNIIAGPGQKVRRQAFCR